MSEFDPDFYSHSEAEISVARQIILKGERVILGFFYFLLFGLAANNVWQYIIKQKMYKSVPMLVTYILLLIFASISIIYEFYMGFACGSHDCMEKLLEA